MYTSHIPPRIYLHIHHPGYTSIYTTQGIYRCPIPHPRVYTGVPYHTLGYTTVGTSHHPGIPLSVPLTTRVYLRVIREGAPTNRVYIRVRREGETSAQSALSPLRKDGETSAQTALSSQTFLKDRV